MMRLLALVGLMFVAAAVLAGPPTVLTPDQLVEQLGSESYAEREAAMKDLEQAGAPAIPTLEAALRNPNPEISKRANEVLASLRRNADTKDRLTPKSLRLSYKSIPLGTAVNDLKSRTGINLVLDPLNIANPLRLVTCETGELPPWEAVAAFCQAAGLKEVFSAELEVPKQEKQRRGYYQPPPPPPPPDTVPVKLADGKYVSLPGSRSTAVRVLALPASFPAHRVYLGTGHVLLHFDVAPMPGLHWRDVAGVRITKVIDDAGRLGASSTVKDPAAGGPDFSNGPVFMGGPGMAFVRWDGDMPTNPTTYPNPRVIPVPIKVATLSSRSLKLLEGAVVCEVAMPGQQLVTIDNISQSAGVAIEGSAGAKLTVVEARAGEKGATAMLKVQTETQAPWLSSRRLNPWGGGFAVEPMQPEGTASRIKGFDAAGKPVLMTAQTTSEFNNDEFTMTSVVQFRCPDGLPVKLVLTGPKPVMVEVPFKMENVQLP